MTSTPDHAAGQFADFRAELARLRKAAGLSQRAVGERLPEHGGEPVTGSAVGEWERGPSAPGPQNVAALESLFDQPSGHLAELLGYGSRRNVDDRLTGIEDTIAGMKGQLDELADLIRKNLARRR